MRLLRFIVRTAGVKVLGLSALSLLSTATNMALLAVVHRALTGVNSSTIIWLFVLAASSRVGTTYVNGWMLAAYEQDSLRMLRANLAQRIVEVPLERFQALGKARLMTTLNEDVMRLQGAMHSLSSMVTAAATTAGGCAYMIYLSPTTFALVASLGVLAALTNRVIARRAWPHFEQARDGEEALQGRLVDLIEGVKELKLHSQKRHDLMKGGVLASIDLAAHHRLQARRVYLLAHVLGQAPAMVAILALIAGAHWGLTTTHQSAGFILAALYIAGPTSALIYNSGALGTASVALARIENIVDGLHHLESSRQHALHNEHDEFRGLIASDLCFSYSDADNSFSLGPVSCEVLPGQVLFITGDNGSGKSTLALLLAGLYQPTSGRIIQANADTTASYSAAEHDHLSAVLSDYHLFDRAWALPDNARTQAIALLHELGIGHLASEFEKSPTPLQPQQLSQGQRRRLALALCLLEDRPFMIFDEFAADQDGDRKEWFYRTLLPRLRSQGKAVVVVTHDQRYFNTADEIIHLQAGRMDDRHLTSQT